MGSNGIPAKYGGFETFVENLTAKKVSPNIKYHIACLGKDNNEFEYNNSRCFSIKVPNIGPAKAIYYDLVALNRSIKYIKKNNIKKPIIYLLGTTIGGFIGFYKAKLKKMGIPLFVNPDGCEWKRKKWNYFVRKYLKLSERFMAKYADLLICDSINIEQYIQNINQKLLLSPMVQIYPSKIHK